MKTKSFTVIVTFLLISLVSFSFISYAEGANTITSLNREDLLSAISNNYSPDTILRWDSHRGSMDSAHNGCIPISLLNDPVYCSMNLPSESRSDYMISAWRDTGHIIGDTSSNNTKQVLAIGSMYPTSGASLPDNFSIYFGKMKLFAYSKSKQCWITLDSNPYPRGIYIYTLPWETSSYHKCTNVSYSSDYLRIELTADELNGNVLHFWCKCVPIDKEDYLYYASAYTFWTDSSVAGKITAVGGIDAKDAAGQKTIIQLYSSRGLSASTSPKTLWGNTVPNSEYLSRNTYVLNTMFSNDDITNSNELTRVTYNTPSSRPTDENTESLDSSDSDGFADETANSQTEVLDSINDNLVPELSSEFISNTSSEESDSDFKDEHSFNNATDPLPPTITSIS